MVWKSKSGRRNESAEILSGIIIPYVHQAVSPLPLLLSGIIPLILLAGSHTPPPTFWRFGFLSVLTFRLSRFDTRTQLRHGRPQERPATFFSNIFHTIRSYPPLVVGHQTEKSPLTPKPSDTLSLAQLVQMANSPLFAKTLPFIFVPM